MTKSLLGSLTEVMRTLASESFLAFGQVGISYTLIPISTLQSSLLNTAFFHFTW